MISETDQEAMIWIGFVIQHHFYHDGDPGIDFDFGGLQKGGEVMVQRSTIWNLEMNVSSDGDTAV